MKMTKMKDEGKVKKRMRLDMSMVILCAVFLMVFLFKALFYGLIGDNTWLIKVLSFIPERILLSIFLPFYYIFILPILWIMNDIPFLYSIYNPFIIFAIDIGLTIIYLTILFFLVKKIVHYFSKKRSK